MDGCLVVDKPAGMTSHDVVDEVRRKLRTKRVGHGGTLDPDATGVLLLGIGKATRFLSYAQTAPKRYEAVVTFGRSTTTQDASGDTVEQRPVDRLTIEQVSNELTAFIGEIDQIPPMVSAVRIGGERLHEKARRGETVERPPRRVTIYDLKLLDHDIPDGSEITIEVTCSGGTYIRTLAHDLGEAVGTGAHLKRLRRTEASGFGVDEAVSLDEVDRSVLRSLADVVRAMERVEVDPKDAAAVANGRPLVRADRVPDVADGERVAVVRDDLLLAVYRVEGDKLLAERVVPS